ncbi:hypothetical protein MNEG_12239, partial [Monoraphidium neglectum]
MSATLCDTSRANYSVLEPPAASASATSLTRNGDGSVSSGSGSGSDGLSQGSSKGARPLAHRLATRTYREFVWSLSFGIAMVIT